MVRTAHPRAAVRGAVYRLYGMPVRSSIGLPYPPLPRSRRAAVGVLLKGSRFFARVRAAAGVPEDPARWFVHAPLPGGGDYLRWTGLFEFRVSGDGREIAARPLDGASAEAFRTYLLGHALAFAMLRRGVEPLHATAVVVDSGAVGFLGDCGYGKSTLGAAFLRAGHPVLTDDLLVLGERAGGFLAYPGPPRIKLFPEVAERVLAGPAGTPMNGATPKLVIPLAAGHAAAVPVPLRAICVLGRPGPARGSRISIRRLAGRRACIELVRASFNTVVTEPRRLARQLDLAARVAARVPVLAVSYPRDLGRLPEVVAAIRRRVDR